MSREAGRITDAVSGFIDLDGLLKSLHKFRHPGERNERRSSIVHHPIDWSKYPTSAYRKGSQAYNNLTTLHEVNEETHTNNETGLNALEEEAMVAEENSKESNDVNSRAEKYIDTETISSGRNLPKKDFTLKIPETHFNNDYPDFTKSETRDQRQTGSTSRFLKLNRANGHQDEKGTNFPFNTERKKKNNESNKGKDKDNNFPTFSNTSTKNRNNERDKQENFNFPFASSQDRNAEQKKTNGSSQNRNADQKKTNGFSLFPGGGSEQSQDRVRNSRRRKPPVNR